LHGREHNATHPASLAFRDSNVDTSVSNQGSLSRDSRSLVSEELLRRHTSSLLFQGMQCKTPRNGIRLLCSTLTGLDRPCPARMAELARADEVYTGHRAMRGPRVHSIHLGAGVQRFRNSSKCVWYCSLAVSCVGVQGMCSMMNKLGGQRAHIMQPS